MEHMVTIRPATEADAPALAEIYAPYVRDTAITFEYEPPTSEEFAARMRSTLAFYPYVVAELDGRPVGYAYASTFKGDPPTIGRLRRRSMWRAAMRAGALAARCTTPSSAR